MARIRTIKPEFPISETIGSLSREARLLYIQLWTVVDDSGRTRAASRLLASQLYPYDDDAGELIKHWIAELESSGCVTCYEVDGTQYLELPKWLKHQKIDRPTPSRLPPNPQKIASPRESPSPLPRTKDLVPSTKVSKGVAKAPASKKTARLPDSWQLDGPGTEYATAHGLDDDQRDQAAVDFLEYYTEGDGLSKQRTELGWRQSWQRWVRTEPNFTRKGKGNGKQPLDLRQGARDVIAGIISYPNKTGGSPATPGDQPAAVAIKIDHLPGDIILVESGGDGGSHADGTEDPVEIFPDSSGDNPAVRKGSDEAVGSEAGGSDQGSASPSGGDRRGSGQEPEGVGRPEAPF